MAYADVLVTAEVNIIAGFYVGCFGSKTVGRQVPAFICICSYLFDFFQLAYIYSISIINACSYVSDYFIVSIQAIFGNVSRATKANAHIIIHEEVTSMNAVNIKVSVQVNLNKGSILVFFLAYGNIFIATSEVNIIAGFYVGCFGSKTVGRQVPAFICICSYLFDFFQLAYVYCIGIISTCCNIGNLTFSVSSAYGYCISSVSYTANAQGNTAFNRYRSTAADSNCIIGCNFILMTEGNNIAYASDYVFVAHYNRIGNISQFIVRTCHEYVMATLFIITGKFVIIADNGRIGLFGNSVGTADYCNSTAFFSSKNRIITKQNFQTFTGANIHILVGIGNSISGTLNCNTIRCLDSICCTHNIVSYTRIYKLVLVINLITGTNQSCSCTLNIYIFLICTQESIYFNFIRSSVTVNYRISTYNSSIQTSGICIGTYKSSTFATADSAGA